MNNFSSATSDSAASGPSADMPQPTPSTAKIGLYGLIALLLVTAAGGWAIYVYITGSGGFNWERFAFQGDRMPKLVRVTGQILFNGKPMENGVVKAIPVGPKSRTQVALGPLEKDGKFELMTDIDGFKTGARIGEYKLVLDVIYPNQPGQLAPTRRLPAEYYSADTTPVTITATADAEQNHFIIRREGVETPGPAPRTNSRKKERIGRKKKKSSSVEDRKTKTAAENESR